MKIKWNFMVVLAFTMSTSSVFAMDPNTIAQDCETIRQQQTALRQQLDAVEQQSNTNGQELHRLNEESARILTALQSLTAEQITAIGSSVRNPAQ